MKKILSKFIEWLKHGNAVFMEYEGYINYPGVGLINDVDVYNLICKHSRLLDRLNPARMVEMAITGQCILMRLYTEIDPDDPSWTFYGKNSLNNKGWM